jgi:hypothetical protein
VVHELHYMPAKAGEAKSKRRKNMTKTAKPAPKGKTLGGKKLEKKTTLTVIGLR